MSEVPNLKIRVLTSPDQVADFWSWLTTPGRRMVAVDTETTGFGWWERDFKVRLAQFGDVNGGWAIPFEGWPSLVTGALDWCSRSRTTTVFHNASADALFLRAMGYQLDWSNVEDTFVWTGVSGFNEQHRGLKESAMREFGPWAGAGERVLHGGMKNQGWSWADVPMGWKPYPLYGVVDTCVTAALWELYDMQGRRTKWKADHDLEIATMRLTGDMSWRGTPIDGDYIAEAVSELQDEEDELRETLKLYGITNPNQNGQLEAALKGEGFDLASKTATGVAKLDKDVLKHIDHPAARATERFRFVTRMKGTYLGAMWRNAGGALGRGIMHPGIQPFEARTGRMAVSNPPLQQLPAEDDAARRAVIPREDDEVVLSSDFGQIELRLWAHIFKDDRMLQRLHEVDKTGEDFFVLVGRDIYNEPGFVKKDPRRTKIKSTIYAKMFAGGIETAAATAGVGVYELVPVWKDLEAAYPSLKTVGQDDIHTEKGPNGLEHSLTSPFGRVFKVADQGERRKLPNYVTQGTAAIALKKALVGLDAAGFGEHMLLPVHDEVVFSMPKGEADEAMHEIAEVMDQVIREEDGWGVSVKAKVGVGANWAEAK
jgi:DNA polymerase I-like protein with 3'-5' exonuclease and polymerase domains